MGIRIICNSAFVICATFVHTSIHAGDLSQIVDKIADPIRSLRQLGPLVRMGNSSIDAAKIVFLPEVHDDPKSLLGQLLLIAREKGRTSNFLILDESLQSLKRSVWDVFSQKALEVIAAQDHRRNNWAYAPRHFEQSLQSLANKFRAQNGALNFSQNSALWVLNGFKDLQTPFYGWDSTQELSLTDRNVQMVKSLKNALKKSDRIFVMLGARHVPELEYLTSQKLLCPESRSATLDQFYNKIQKKFGNRPRLAHGIGATTPIYNFIRNQKYAVVFTKTLHNELERVVKNFKRSSARNCYRL